MTSPHQITPHKVTLPQCAASLLAQILASPGHLTRPDDLYRAGGVIEDHLAGLPPTPKTGDEAAFTAWADAPLTIELTERQRATCQEAVRACCAKGGIGAGRYTRAMLGALGLGEG